MTLEQLMKIVVDFLTKSMVSIPMTSTVTIDISLMDACIGGLLTVIICEAVWNMID